MQFRQFIHEDLGCGSYLVACGGSAVIVDPQWNIDPYLAFARDNQLQITDIAITHNHADHVSGHGRLKAATGATIHVSAEAGVDYEHRALHPGDEITVGKATLRAIATPGHRPEHMSFLVIDGIRSDEPVGLLSGDFLFVGDIARPDLAVKPRDGASAIFDSLQQLADSPAQLEIWPGHVGGSLCGGAGMSQKPSTTIGYERANNDLLTSTDREHFVDEMTSGLSPQPPNFQRIAEGNRGPLLTEAPAPTPLTPHAAKALLDAGAVVIDIRDPREFDAEHIPGSLSVTAATSAIGTRAAWLTRPETEVIVVAGSDEQALATLPKLQAAGMLATRGYLVGGVAAWRDAGLNLASIDVVNVSGLADLLRGDERVVLVDVRDEDEWLTGHVAGSIHAPFHRLREELPVELRDLPAGTRVAVACAAGNRSSLGASHLRRSGIQNVDHVADGGVLDLPQYNIQLTVGA
ncbi:MAG: MBL fold metallo-hydrolase [Gaiellales bacterium]